MLSREEKVRFGVATHIVEVHQDLAVGALGLEKLLGDVLQTSHLVLGLLDNPLEGTQFGGRCTLVEQVDVDVGWDGKLPGGNGLQQGTLAAAVLAQQAVAAAKVKLEGAVGDEDAAVEDQADRGDLDVAARGDGGQDTSGNTVRNAVLVHLFGEARNLVHLGRRGGGLVRLDGVAVGVELQRRGGIAVDRAGGAGILGASLGPGGDGLLALALGGLLGQSLLLG